jgi:hypothetical protein
VSDTESDLASDAPSVDQVIQVLLELVDQGLLVMRHPEQPDDEYWREATDEYAKWLRSAQPGELFQEYGPWFELTEKGRAELPAHD